MVCSCKDIRNRWQEIMLDGPPGHLAAEKHLSFSKTVGFVGVGEEEEEERDRKMKERTASFFF